MHKELKGTEEYYMFNALWTMMKKYYIPENTDEYWQSVVNAHKEFCKKYPSKLALDLSTAFINDLQRRSKENEQSRNN